MSWPSLLQHYPRAQYYIHGFDRPPCLTVAVLANSNSYVNFDFDLACTVFSYTNPVPPDPSHLSQPANLAQSAQLTFSPKNHQTSKNLTNNKIYLVQLPYPASPKTKLSTP
jgi:hypothetical protein